MGKTNPRPYKEVKLNLQLVHRCNHAGCTKSYMSRSALKAHIRHKHSVNTDDIQVYTASIADDHVSSPDDMDYSPSWDAISEYESEDEKSEQGNVLEYSEDEDESDDEENEEREIIDNIMANRQNILDLNENDWEQNISDGNPFGNTQTMIMKCLFNGYSSLLSRSQLKTLLYGVNKIVDLAVESTKANKPFTMPSANTIMKSETGKKYDGPSITTTTIEHTVIVKNKEKVSKCSANMPSEHLKLSLTNPRISKYLSALPDRTEGVSKNLTTGEKWKSHPLFQPPQISIRNIDFWIGDVVQLDDSLYYFLIQSFFCKDGINQVDGYFVVKKDDRYMILPELSMVPQDKMNAVLDKQLIASNNCFSMFNGSLCPLPKHLQNLLFQVNDSKVKKSNNVDNKYLKVIIIPIIFFTDDTSGGSSKQHIPYESWSMTYAALPLEERGRRENTMFIGCAPKSDGINAMHFIPALVADMKALEKGVAMFSGEHNETVLVKAPVMFISADNPAHSDICGIQQQTTLYFCRKCYVRKSSKKKNRSLLESGITVH